MNKQAPPTKFPTVPGYGVLPNNPDDVVADSGYRGQRFISAVLPNGVQKSIRISAWGRPGDDTVKRLKRWNYGVQHIRTPSPRLSRVIEPHRPPGKIGQDYELAPNCVLQSSAKPGWVASDDRRSKNFG
jgi:hypothetical protein